MDLQGDLSKSTFATALKCAWKAFTHKVTGIKSIPTAAAINGNHVHDLWRLVTPGQITLEEAIERSANDEVRGLIANAVAYEPIPHHPDQTYEAKLSADGIMGYLDRRGPDPTDNVHFVQDLKTGRWEQDDEFERDAYSYLEFVDTGEAPIKFIRYFCRSGNAYTYHYSRDELTGPVRDRILAAVDLIKKMPAEPMPGDHCTNWYGSPCQFLGNLCPLSQVPALVDNQAPLMGQAFLQVKNGDINPQTAALAYQACQQLQTAVDQVMGHIKDHTRSNGPITVGSDQFGWRNVPAYNVDKAFVLEALADADVSWEDVARIVSISRTSLARLPRRLGAIKQHLLKLAVSVDTETERFGKL